MPATIPCASEKRPEASGRSAVRFMRASVVRSTAWFSAPAPAETSPIPSSVSSNPRCILEIPDCIEPR